MNRNTLILLAFLSAIGLSIARQSIDKVSTSALENQNDISNGNQGKSVNELFHTQKKEVENKPESHLNTDPNKQNPLHLIEQPIESMNDK